MNKNDKLIAREGREHDESTDYENPCPACGTMHRCSDYRTQSDGRICPDTVKCTCGVTLRHCVPIFKPNASGWIWRIVS